MIMRSWPAAALLALAAPARAGGALEASNEAVEGAWSAAAPFGSWTLEGRVASGLLAPDAGLFGPYPILKPSPYAVASARAAARGAWDSAVKLCGSFTLLRSSPYFRDADDAGKLFAQRWAGASGSASTGRIFAPSESLRSAVYAAVDAFMFGDAAGPEPGGIGMAYLHLGNAWLWKDGARERAWGARVRLEGAHQDMYSNWAVTVAPAASVYASLAREGGGPRREAGVELQASRADLAVRPFARLAGSAGSAEAAVELRKSLHSFIPDRAGLGLGASTALGPRLDLGVGVRAFAERYPMEARPSGAALASARLSWSLGRTRLEAGRRGARGTLAAAFDRDGQRELSGRLPGPGYEAGFRLLLEAAPAFADFIRQTPVRGSDDILAAVSQWTGLFNANNYNFDEARRRNLRDPDELYRRARASFLEGRNDPILVCIGAAQFAAMTAEALGRKAGIPIQATAVTVAVRGEGSNMGGHAVALVKTPEYGIVIVDWGLLTPTGTKSTEEALRAYQGLVGLPEVFHAVTDAGRGGSHVAYLYSREGRLFLKRLTHHQGEEATVPARALDDVPDGGDAAFAHYLGALREDFERR